MKHEKLVQAMIPLVGGKDNIKAVAHCVTRLRLTLRNRDIAQVDDMKQLDGVIDVVSNEVAFQIIIGTHVTEVYNDLMSVLGLSTQDKQTVEKKDFTVKGLLNGILAAVSETMTSIIVPLLAAGILISFLSILDLVGILSADSPTFYIFNALREATFFFLPVLIAASAARRFKVNQYLAMVLALALVSPAISQAESLAVFGFNLPVIDYAFTFIPLILAVWTMSWVEKGLNKIIPKALHYFLVPVFTLIIVLPITLALFGPIGMWFGLGLEMIFTWLYESVGYWIVVTIYAAFQPFLIALGAANFLFPITLNFFATVGYDPIITHAATLSDIAVAGAMIGYFLRVKNTKEKQMFGTVGVTAALGVTEPAVFGAFLMFRKPFLAVIIGGGLGGLFAGVTGVISPTMAWGLFSLPTFLEAGTQNFIFMLIAFIISFVTATVAGYILAGSKKSAATNPEVSEGVESSRSDGQILVGSVANGKKVPLHEVADEAFASEALGKGIGVLPKDEVTDVFAPVEGEVTVVFPTKHAYGIKTANGLEVLIHIGLNTVNLDGEYFTSHVEVGQRVEVGDLVATYDVSSVKKAGFDPTILVVITNTKDYLDVIANLDQHQNGLLTIV